MQDPKTKHWDSTGEIILVREDGLSYVISSNRKDVIRPRYLIRPLQLQGQGVEPVESYNSVTEEEPLPVQPLRRSDRIKNKQESAQTWAEASPKNSRPLRPWSTSSATKIGPLTAGTPSRASSNTNRLCLTRTAKVMTRPSPRTPNGFSLVSVNSAQLATGIGDGSLLLLITFGTALYCWCRHRSNRKRKRRHDQLLQVFSHRADGGHGSSNSPDAIPLMGGPPPPVPGAYWTRTPMGWASLPLPASNPFVPQFPGLQPAQGALYSASYSAPECPFCSLQD